MNKKEILATLKKWGFATLKVKGKNIEVYRGTNKTATIGYDPKLYNGVWINNKAHTRKQLLGWIIQNNPPQLSLF